MTEESESHGEPAGNTKTAGRTRQECQLYRWFFTLKAGESQESQKSQSFEVWYTLNEVCKEFHFQLEKGEGGYMHFQGVFSLKTKQRRNELKNLLGYNNIHLEACKEWFPSIKYCTKSESRVAGPWDTGRKPIKPKIEGILRPWQQEVLSLIDTEPDDRSIRIYQDPIGNAGKSTFGIHLSDIRSDVLYIPSGRFEGVKEKCVRTINARRIRAVIFDIPRAKGDWIPHALMEELKNGCILNTRYELQDARFDPVHVILFTNQNCESWQYEEYFSKDRLQIIQLS